MHQGVKNLVILGAPGAGKGTQAKKLAADFNWQHLSTGDMLREAIQTKSEVGLRAKDLIEKGDLVSDELIIEMMKSKLLRKEYKKGLLLDGYPRTINQAIQLDAVLPELGLRFDGVIYINVPDEAIVTRISQRVICSSCGAVVIGQNAEAPCSECGGSLARRKDDDPETIRHRLKVYKENTCPLIDYYKKQDLLFEIDGTGMVPQVYSRILGALGLEPDNA